MKGASFKRKLYRVLTGVTFNLVIRMLFLVNCSDTQGVKFLRLTDKMWDILDSLVLDCFLVDTELSLKVLKSRFSIREIPWNLVEIDSGSKVDLISMLRMLFRLSKLALIVNRASSYFGDVNVEG